MAEKILDINDLHLSFFTPVGEVKGLNGVTFSLEQGEVVIGFCSCCAIYNSTQRLTSFFLTSTKPPCMLSRSVAEAVV